jgi:hypothetical protein
MGIEEEEYNCTRGGRDLKTRGVIVDETNKQHEGVGGGMYTGIFIGNVQSIILLPSLDIIFLHRSR